MVVDEKGANVSCFVVYEAIIFLSDDSLKSNVIKFEEIFSNRFHVLEWMKSLKLPPNLKMILLLFG